MESKKEAKEPPKPDFEEEDEFEEFEEYEEGEGKPPAKAAQEEVFQPDAGWDDEDQDDSFQKRLIDELKKNEMS